MNQKRQYKTYTKAFKEEALVLVNDQGSTDGLSLYLKKADKV